MPHYFFHCADGARNLDQTGIDLPDDQTARLQAMAYAGEVLRHAPQKIWDLAHWRVEVTNDAQRLLFTVIVVAVDAPPPVIDAMRRDATSPSGPELVAPDHRRLDNR